MSLSVEVVFAMSYGTSQGTEDIAAGIEIDALLRAIHSSSFTDIPIIFGLLSSS